MKFCPNCDNMLFVKKNGKKRNTDSTQKMLKCNSCGYEEPFNNEVKNAYTINLRLSRDEKDKTLVIKGIDDIKKVTDEEREANEWMFGVDEDFQNE